MKIKQLLGSLMAMATLTTCAFAAVGCSTDSAQGVPVEQTQTGGMVISEGKSNSVSLMATTISADEYEEYGIATTAESAQLLTLNIKPTNATVISVTWTVDWVNPANGWAMGKKATDYVSVTQQTNKISATVACLQDFGSQIKVAYELIDGEDNKWSNYAMIDYFFKPSSVAYAKINDTFDEDGVFYSGWEYEEGADFSISLNTEKNYTINYTVFETSVTFCFPSSHTAVLVKHGFSLVGGHNGVGSLSVPHDQIRYAGNLFLNALSDTDIQSVIGGEKKEAFFAAMQEIAKLETAGDCATFDIELSDEVTDFCQSFDFTIWIGIEDFVTPIESVTISDSHLYF